MAASPVPYSRTLLSILFFASMGAIAWHDRHQSVAQWSSSGLDPDFAMREVSKASGIDFVHRAPELDPKLAHIMPHVAGMGAAVSVCDANSDGAPDLYATNSALGTPNALYLNRGDGTFVESAAAAGLADLNRPGVGASMGSIWADADNDGDEDVLVYRWGKLFFGRNDGGNFTDATAAAGLERWMNSNSAVWLDYDRDGLVDLYVAGYFPDEIDLWNLQSTKIMQESFEFATNGGHNYLYKNLGGLRFQDVTAQMGCDSTRWTLGVAAADLNGDGWQDLYLANDYGPEELFVNREGRRFELLRGAGLDENSKSGMCVAFGDFENKGELGVYVTNISVPRFLFQGNNLRINRLAEDGKFFNIAKDQVANCGWAWGAQFGDLDNDGFRDLFVANGFISASKERDYWYEMGKIAGAAGPMFIDAVNWPEMGDRSLSGYERSRVLWNRLGRRFVDVAQAVGVEDLCDGRAVAMADLAGRGALDVIVANQKGPLLVYRAIPEGPAEARHWIAFDLVGTQSNRSAIGAEVTVSFGGQRQVAVVDGGSGFCSQNDRRLHFGLGVSDSIERAVIRWPSGREQVLEGLAVDRRHRIVEGG